MSGPGTGRAVRRLGNAVRAVEITAILLVAAAHLAGRLGVATVRRHPARAVVAAECVTRTAERLGPTFVKLGQLLSTRVDLLPAALRDALGRLHDAVLAPVALSEASIPAALAADLAGPLRQVAAGSIATVYHGDLRDGRAVAVKVRRPRVGTTIDRDLALIRHTVVAAERLPAFRGAGLVAAIDQVGAAIRQQVDFGQESRSLADLRTNLAGLGAVRVPRILPAYCTDEVVVMEFVPSLTQRHEPSEGTRTATLLALRAVYHMLFVDGFVHCDLHPGNLHPRPDGSVVIVDAGMCRRLPDAARRSFATFFHHMSRGEGAACAEVVLGTVADAPGRAADVDGFRAAMTSLVTEARRQTVADFDLVRFAASLFALQRRYGLHADPQFIFPLLSLIVMEGTLRRFCPDVDFQVEAIPYVLQGLMVGRPGDPRPAW